MVFLLFLAPYSCSSRYKKRFRTFYHPPTPSSFSAFMYRNSRSAILHRGTLPRAELHCEPLSSRFWALGFCQSSFQNPIVRVVFVGLSSETALACSMIFHRANHIFDSYQTGSRFGSLEWRLFRRERFRKNDRMSVRIINRGGRLVGMPKNGHSEKALQNQATPTRRELGLSHK